ncbi:uncharacterized protein PHA67_021038 [Liasis olivaceus]
MHCGWKLNSFDSWGLRIPSASSAPCNTKSEAMVCRLPDSSWLFSASRDKTVLMWDLRGGSEAAWCFLGHRLVVTGLAVSSVFQKLCTDSCDNTVCLWDTETGQFVQDAHFQESGKSERPFKRRTRHMLPFQRKLQYTEPKKRGGGRKEGR